MKSLIGLTSQPSVDSEMGRRGSYCDASYAQAVVQAGGIPVILPLTNHKPLLDRFLSRCDGFLLTGGGDMTEESGAYKRSLSPSARQTLGGLDPMRDEMELYMVRQIVEANLPLLGICRGIQVMNVALGGTLLPDVPGHRHPQPCLPSHLIQWTRDGHLCHRMRECRRVNSTHHQAVDRVASALRVTARAEDGIIEAIELPDAKYCVGVQFHPERLLDAIPQFLVLFRRLIVAANSRHARL